MKFFTIVSSLVAAVAAQAPQVADQNALLRSKAGLEGDYNFAPVCSSITCADIACQPPFQLTVNDGQCCPTCVASDEDVALDRHTAIEGGSPHRTDQSPAAPADCAGALCFTPSCRKGEKIAHVADGCCLRCVK